MDWTMGSMLFYGGIIGVVATLVITIITIFILSKSRTRLKTKLDSEYGKK